METRFTLPPSLRSFHSRARRTRELKLEQQRSQAHVRSLLDSSPQDFSWSAGELRQLNSLAQIPQKREFFESLVNFGVGLKSNREWKKAAHVLESLIRNPHVPAEIRAQAEREFNPLVGKGSFGLHCEVLTGQFLDQAGDPRSALPWFGVSLLGQAVEAGVLGRLAFFSRATRWTRGIGAGLAAKGAAYLAELPAFAALSRAFADHPEGSFSDELKRSAITVGAMKLAGVPQLIAAGRPAAAGIQQWMHSPSLFLGLLAAHKLEEFVDLRPTTDTATAVTDTFAAMIHLSFASRLGQWAFGSRAAAFQAELAARARGSSSSEKPAWGQTPAWETGTPARALSRSGVTVKEDHASALTIVKMKNGDFDHTAPSSTAPAPAFFESALKMAQTHPSVLRKPHRQKFFGVLRQGATGELSPERAIILASQVLLDDWVAGLVRYGVTETHYPFSDFLQELDPAENPGLAWMQNWCEASKDEPVIRLEMNDKTLRKFLAAASENRSRILLTAPLLGLTGVEMGLSSDALSRFLPNNQILNILPMRLLLEGPSWMNGANTIGYTPVADLVTEAETSELMQNDSRPLVVAAHAVNIHAVTGAHPFIALLHDAFHRWKLSGIHREARGDLLQLYWVFKGLSERYPALQEIYEDLLDGDLGGDRDHRSLFLHIKQQHPSSAMVEAIGQSLRTVFAETPRGRRILQAFEEICSVAKASPLETRPGLARTSPHPQLVRILSESSSALTGAPEEELISRTRSTPPESEDSAENALTTTQGIFAFLPGSEPHQHDGFSALAADVQSYWEGLQAFVGGHLPQIAAGATTAVVGLGIFAGIQWLRRRHHTPLELEEAPVSLDKLQVSPTQTAGESQPNLRLLQTRDEEPGWIGRRYKKLQRVLRDKKSPYETINGEARAFMADVMEIMPGNAEAETAAASLWNLAFDSRLAEETRFDAIHDYLHFVSRTFIEGPPPHIFNEASRLRGIFSSSHHSLSTRVMAVMGYGYLILKIGPDGPGGAELIAGQKAIAPLITEAQAAGDENAYYVKATSRYLESLLAGEK